jgi:hypothetical protein
VRATDHTVHTRDQEIDPVLFAAGLGGTGEARNTRGSAMNRVESPPKAKRRAGNTALRESNLLSADCRRSPDKLQALLQRRFNRVASIDEILCVLLDSLAKGLGGPVPNK